MKNNRLKPLDPSRIPAIPYQAAVSLRHKCQLKVIDDPAHHGIVGEERDNPHLSSTLRADYWV